MRLTLIFCAREAELQFSVRSSGPAAVLTKAISLSWIDRIQAGSVTRCLFALIVFAAVLTGLRARAAELGYNFSRLAGPPQGAGAVDGPSADARFLGPTGVAVDATGNFYVSDGGNNTVRRITPGGEVTTFAGSAAESGSQDGHRTVARFKFPGGIAVDAAGNIYLADRGNFTIRKISTDGQVTTLAGMAGQSGSDDGEGAAARFQDPTGVAISRSGNLFVTDSRDYTVRKVTPTGSVTTFAGMPGQSVHADGTGNSARFRTPRGIVVDADDNIFVADYGSNTIRKITPTAVVTTFVGSPGVEGNADGTSTQARFSGPMGLSVGPSGSLLVVDFLNHTIRKITSAGVVSTLAGSIGQAGWEDGVGAAARFSAPQGVTMDTAGNAYVGDSGNNAIRKITPMAVVTTLAGLGTRFGSSDGAAGDATFRAPRGVAIDRAGNVYVGDSSNGTVRKISPAGVVTTIAGMPGESGSADGIGPAARFGYINAIAVHTDGSLYVADGGNCTIRKIAPGGVVTTLAGTTGVAGSIDGTGTAAQFSWPTSLAVDAAGNVYVADGNNHMIRKITPEGIVTTHAGSPKAFGYDDGTGAAATFALPTGIASKSDGTLYVAALGTIRKITPAGVVSTIAGSSAGATGFADGASAAARFGVAFGIAVLEDGTVFVSDTYNNTIRKISTSGVVSTIGGVGGRWGSRVGPGSETRFANPYSMAVDSTGTLYIADTNNHGIVKGVLGPPIPDVTWADPQPVVYGAALSGEQLKATAAVPGTFVYTPASGSVLNAGTHQLSVSFTPSDTTSYSSVILARSLVINKAPLVVKAEDKVRHRGSANPLLTATYSGFVNGDSASVIDSMPVFSTTAAVDSPEGVYPIQISGGSDNNYSLIHESGTLTIKSATYTGSYFGDIGNAGGKWALHVNANDTGTYIAYLARRQTAVVVQLSIGPDGSFDASGAEEVGTADRTPQTASGNAGGYRRTAANTNFSLQGRISDGAVTGTLLGLGETFSGTATASSGSAPSGFYAASGLNSTVGKIYAIVAPNGQALVIVGAPAVDAAAGVLVNGQLTASGLSGAQLAMSINAQHAITAAVTPAGAGTPLMYGGLAEGVTSTTRIVNLSARSRAGKGDKTLIMGFVTAGGGAKEILVRGLGPLLKEFGVSEALADPQLQLYAGPTQIDFNDNWGGGAVLGQTFALLGATPLLNTSKDSALSRSITSGAYSAHISTVAAETGIVLAEVYDVSKTAARLINVSARSEARPGDDILVAGFVLEGNGPKTLLIRGLGPTLEALGVGGALADPQLRVFDRSNLLVAENNNWGGTSELKSKFMQLGAVALSSDTSKDAAVLVTLNPGVYSVHVSGVNNTSGIAVVEVYEVP